MLLSLPLELVLEIISYLIPSKSDQSLGATKDLLSLTLLCKATYIIATDLLLRHCVVLTKKEAINKLSNGALRTGSYYSHAKGGTAWLPTEAIIQLESRYLRSRSRSRWLGQYHRPDWTPQDDEPMWEGHVRAFDRFFWNVGHCLTRLVLASDFHKISGIPAWIKGQNGPEPRYNALTRQQRKVRHVFRRLTVLEEFICVQANRYVCCPGNGDTKFPVWAYFPKLRRLALPHVDVKSDVFVKGLSFLKNLEELVLVCPDSLGEQIPTKDFSKLPTKMRLTVAFYYDDTVYSACRDQGTFFANFVDRSDPQPTHSVSLVRTQSLRKPRPHDDAIWLLTPAERWLTEAARDGFVWDIKAGGYDIDKWT